MTSENDVPKFLRFCDLQDRGLVQSHAGLRHLQIHENFPLGRLLGPSTRVWTVDEVNAWLAFRPTEPSRQTKERAAKSLEARNTARDPRTSLQIVGNGESGDRAFPSARRSIIDEVLER